MQEGLDVIQRVGGSSPEVGPGARSVEGNDYPIFVQHTVDPCEVPEACGGERLHLSVIVIEQNKVELLQFSPVTVVRC